MTKTVTVYGHNIELDEIDPEGIITDVLIVTRTVIPDDNSDYIDIISSNTTTGVVSTGMLNIAHTMSVQNWLPGDADD